MLEINTLPGRDLREAIVQHGESRVLRELNIHPKTLYRWLTGRCAIPGRQHLAIRALLGDLPGTDGKWSGWMFRQGRLWSPEGRGFTPGDLQASLFDAQRLRVLEREVRELRSRLDDGGRARVAGAGAAVDVDVAPDHRARHAGCDAHPDRLVAHPVESHQRARVVRAAT